MLGDVAFAQVPFASQGGNTFNAAVSETGSIDSATVNTYIGVATNAESVSALDAQSVAAAFISALSESASGGGVFDTKNNIFNVSFSDSASGTDATSVQVDFAGLMQEAASTAEIIVSQANFVAAVIEAASALDELQGGLLIQVAVSESASTSAANTARVIFSGSIQEFAAGLDSLSVVKSLNVSVTGVQLVVSIGDVLIWATINDNQDPNWQNVNDTQSTAWVVISNPSTPGWNVLPS
jgi:hypothetical protein